jgi:hypothetical protein
LVLVVVAQQDLLITFLQTMVYLVVIQSLQQLHLPVADLVQVMLVLLLVELAVLAVAVELVQVEA